MTPLGAKEPPCFRLRFRGTSYNITFSIAGSLLQYAPGNMISKLFVRGYHLLTKSKKRNGISQDRLVDSFVMLRVDPRFYNALMSRCSIAVVGHLTRMHMRRQNRPHAFPSIPIPIPPQRSEIDS